MNTPDTIKVFTLLAELIARQEGRELKDIKIMKKGEAKAS